jgi:hypothetical protein
MINDEMKESLWALAHGRLSPQEAQDVKESGSIFKAGAVAAVEAMRREEE